MSAFPASTVRRPQSRGAMRPFKSRFKFIKRTSLHQSVEILGQAGIVARAAEECARGIWWSLSEEWRWKRTDRHLENIPRQATDVDRLWFYELLHRQSEHIHRNIRTIRLHPRPAAVLHKRRRIRQRVNRVWCPEQRRTAFTSMWLASDFRSTLAVIHQGGT